MGSMPTLRPDRTLIRGSLEISRMINGLWQLAGGHDKDVDIATAADVMDKMALRGLDTFDMADHYGDAELVVGRHNKMFHTGKVAFTKWCPPENGVKTFENARAAVNLALERMGQSKIDILQYHAWDFSDDTYLHNLYHLRTLQKQGKISFIGLTNTDAAHLELLLDTGFPIATNQVSTSVIDRRLTQGRLNDVCVKNDVGILAYGTLLGGFLSEKWLGQPEPKNIDDINWSLRKYLRFIWAAGGWGPFQVVLGALETVAKKHNVSIAVVATRYVLDIASVKAVIVGTRLSAASTGYVESNLQIASGKRVEYSTGSLWEPIGGYCRAVRTGNTIRVSGTTANSPIPSIPAIGGSSARSQTVHILDIVEGALKALGSSMSDVVRTRIMVRDVSVCKEVCLAHGWVFGNAGVYPANTFITAGLVGDQMLVEIETEAEVGCAENGVLKIQKLSIEA